MLNITVAGVAYPVPSSAADVNWAAAQLAFEKALAAAVAAGPAVQRLFTNAVQVGNGADNTEDTLMSYSMPAATLAAGKGLRVTAWGSGVNTADATTLRAYVGGQLALNRALTASQSNTWRAVLEVLSIDGALASVAGTLLQGGVATQQQVVEVPSFALNVALAQLVKFTGQRGGAATANSITQDGMVVELIP